MLFRSVLAVIESVERTEDDGAGNIRRTTLRAMREGDERRMSIALKRRRREFELSLKAVLSVVIFLLAIVGIAWLGSVAVAYTWPPKGTSPKGSFAQEEISFKIERLSDDDGKEYFKTEDVGWPLEVRRRIPAHTTLNEVQKREIAMKSVERRNGELIESLASYSSKSLAASLSEASSSSSAFEYDARRVALSVSAASSSLAEASASSVRAATPISSSIFSPDILQKLQAKIGNQPIYNCRLRPGWSDGQRTKEDLESERQIYVTTGEILKYNRPEDFWCMYDGR